MDEPMHPLYLVTFFIVSSMIMMRKKRWEVVFVRLLVAFWFFLLWAIPAYAGAELPVMTQRIIGRWIILLIALTEILWEVIANLHKRWPALQAQMLNLLKRWSAR